MTLDIPRFTKINICEKQITYKFHSNYKKYRNLLSTFMKKSNRDYYAKYFTANWNNHKNRWGEIKSFISLKTVTSSVSTVPSFDNGDIITNPYDTANTFNNCFVSIARTIVGLNVLLFNQTLQKTLSVI